MFTEIMKNAVFWDVALCRFCVNRRFGGMYHLHLQGRKIREQGTSMSGWLCHIPEDGILHNHCCENLNLTYQNYVPRFNEVKNYTFNFGDIISIIIGN
jgi:hypothetical protein